MPLSRNGGAKLQFSFDDFNDELLIADKNVWFKFTFSIHFDTSS